MKKLDCVVTHQLEKHQLDEFSPCDVYATIRTFFLIRTIAKISYLQLNWND